MAGQIQLVIENEAEVLAAFKRLGIAPEKVLEAALRAGADVIEIEAIAAGPGDGIAQDTVKKTKDVVEVDVGPDAAHWYYRFLESGAQPHEVVPKSARALQIGDKFIARADHPGFAAEPFLRPAVDNNVGEIEDEVGRPIKRAVEGSGRG